MVRQVNHRGNEAGARIVSNHATAAKLGTSYIQNVPVEIFVTLRNLDTAVFY